MLKQEQEEENKLRQKRRLFKCAALINTHKHMVEIPGRISTDPVSASYRALRAQGSIHPDHSPGFHGASSSCPLVTLYPPY